MRIKLDENLPTTLAKVLAKLGHDVDTVPQEALQGKTDTEVWSASQEAQRFLITQDLDFSDLRRFAPGTHRGVLLARWPIPRVDFSSNELTVSSARKPLKPGTHAS